MPTYIYRCKSCGHELEQWQKISDEPLTSCPTCHQDNLVRVIGGGAGLIFKGSGFYRTDYKKNAPATKTETNDTTEKKSESVSAEKTAAESPPKADTKHSS